MAATLKMIEYAKAIAEKLDIDEPDFSNFDETSSFISENVDEYKYILEKEKIIDTLENSYGDFEQELSEEFKAAIYRIGKRKGLYIFWSNEKVAYIGKSLNLQERIYSSLQERVKKADITNLSVIFTERVADMHILEVIYITEYKPFLNKDCMCEDLSKHFQAPIRLEEIGEEKRLKIFK